MKIKALWGFHGDASKLKAESSRVIRGQEFEVAAEYGHALIGQGLVEEVKATEPKTSKPAAPKENK